MKAVVVAPGDGRVIAVGSAGTGVTVKVTAAETDGLCTVWEGRVPPGTVGAGPHLHHGRDEFFYVLEGGVVLRLGHESHRVRAGTFAFIPRETIHGFHNASEKGATLLVFHHPAAFEQLLEEMQALTARHGSSDERAAPAARSSRASARPADLLPVSRSSLCSSPGSRKCTCVSMTPGRTCRPAAFRDLPAFCAERLPMATILPSLTPISARPSPA